MRTVIFVGLMSIAIAIKDAPMETTEAADFFIRFLGVMFIICVVMDLIEWVDRLGKE